MKFSYTMMSCYRRCRFRFYLDYVEKLVQPPSDGQLRGRAGHEALASWYKQPQEMREDGDADELATDRAWEIWSGEKEGEGDYEGFESLEIALARYFNWAREKDQWEMVALEYHFDVPLVGEHTLQGYVDGIVREQEEIWLLENKFQKQVSTQHLDLDSQVGLYMIGAHLSGYSPIGVIYNIVRIGSGPTAEKRPVERKMLYRNPAGLNALIRETAYQAEEMVQFLEEGGAIYRNPTRDCAWDCAYKDACLSINDEGEANSILETFERRT